MEFVMLRLRHKALNIRDNLLPTRVVRPLKLFFSLFQKTIGNFPVCNSKPAVLCKCKLSKCLALCRFLANLFETLKTRGLSQSLLKSMEKLPEISSGFGLGPERVRSNWKIRSARIKYVIFTGLKTARLLHGNEKIKYVIIGVRDVHRVLHH